MRRPAVSDPEVKRFGALPSAVGIIARLAYAQTIAAGIDVARLLKKAGLTPQQIDDASVRIKVRDQINFLNLASDALQDEFLGFHLAQPPDLRELGLLYYVSASSETLTQALRRAARYSTIANEGVSLNYANERDATVTFRYVGVSRHLDRHQMEFFATTVVRVCRELTGQHVFPTRVRLTHRRRTVSPELAEFFGGNVEFGAADDDISFAAAAGLLPVVSADLYLNRLLIKYCEEALSRRPANLGSFRSAVENAVVPLLPHGKAQAAEIATGLGMSQRTFARRLSAEGATYSDVLESLRSDLAQRYLADDTLTISQIAWLLGYQEVSAFTHAFKRWTGVTPREARSRLSC
ncbi:MAG: AraC family transcriptional regulator [Xanthobacteraceae bacterium]|nr:AraC family transcriptional regulator [Xanthobacteraceae bacterium]